MHIFRDLYAPRASLRESSAPVVNLVAYRAACPSAPLNVEAAQS
jgi:hypothetical protein